MPSEIIKNQDQPEQRHGRTNGISLSQPISFLRTVILALLAQACAGNAVPVRGQQVEARQVQQHVQPEPAKTVSVEETRQPEPVQVNVSSEPTKNVATEAVRDLERERIEEVERIRREFPEPTCIHPAQLSQAQVEARRRSTCFDYVRNRFLSCIAQENSSSSPPPLHRTEGERRCHETYEAQRAQCNRWMQR